MSTGTHQDLKPETASTGTSRPVKKRVFSGVQPTGNIHIGNYLGAIRNWANSLPEYDNIFCIVDLHALTQPIDPQELRQATRQLAALYIACGLDTRYCNLFVQSHMHEHTEASWIMTCFTPMGWLSRMTQFKAKAGENMDSVSTGLYCYPVLMACDILLYQTHLVPVGEDQRQHIELTRDLAQRFNSLYKQEIFTIPEPQIRTVGARVMALDDPTKKMSKSDPNASSRISLLDDPKTIKQKIGRATTDSLRLVTFDAERPGINNLLEMYQALTGQPHQEIEAEFAGKGYGDFKAALTERLVETLAPIQQRYRELMSDPGHVEGVLKQGADNVRPLAEATLRHIKEAVGLS
ncbi:MAG: tryptophan--tRNA ligase [Ktedonobacteraceae bacterium]|nr:tryptophan--tRNA ligase [Ktedonobacteraceae bacterium]